MASLNVFIDTNALPRDPSRVGTTFTRLSELANMDIVHIFLSRVVVEELRSQWLANFADNLTRTLDLVRYVAKHPWLEGMQAVDKLKEIDKELDPIREDSFELSNRKISDFLNNLHAEILEIENYHGNKIIQSYFKGSPPFRNVKSREDFPDAFIFECAIDLVGKGLDLHCIVADSTMMNSLINVEHVKVYKDIYTFLQSDIVRMEVRRVEVERAWQEILERVRPMLPIFSNAIKNTLANQEPYLDALHFYGVYHTRLPSDSGEAYIAGVYNPENIVLKWDQLGDFGPGSISVPITFESKVDIEFDIFRGDAFDVPDEVYVDIQDPEIHTYFEASATLRVQVDAMMIVNFDWEDKEDDELLDELEIEVDEIESVTVIEDSKGNIFLP